MKLDDKEDHIDTRMHDSSLEFSWYSFLPPFPLKSTNNLIDKPIPPVDEPTPSNNSPDTESSFLLKLLALSKSSLISRLKSRILAWIAPERGNEGERDYVGKILLRSVVLSAVGLGFVGVLKRVVFAR
jgi:hypothetical protein